jgi:hypothetical protein
MWMSGVESVLHREMKNKHLLTRKNAPMIIFTIIGAPYGRI